MTTCTCRQHLNAAFEGRRFYFKHSAEHYNAKKPRRAALQPRSGEKG